MTPCQKYQYLVRGPDGQTVADPYGMVPTLGDLEEWKTVVSSILRRVRQELERGGDSVPGNLRQRYEGIAARADDLPSAWSFDLNTTYGPAIVEAVKVAQDAACLLGQVEQAIVDAGGEAMDEPTKPVGANGKKNGGLGVGALGWLAAAAVAALAFWPGDDS